MNRRMIAFILKRILIVEAALMLPSVLIGLIYAESAAAAFLLPMAISVGLGFLIGIKKPVDTSIYARDGFFVVAAGWILMSVIGALPFYFSGCFASIWDCIFEIVSGFTTTGASILPDPESLPKCILFWRSFSNWIGGMGVLVFVLAVLPVSEERSLHLMRAEVPGPVVGKLVPRMRNTAKILYLLYGVMTCILIILLLAGGMPLFDSVCHAFATAGTGGFSVKTAGIMFYQSEYIEIVIGIFMILFGVNFNLYYLILIGRARTALKSEELRWYIVIVAAAVAIIAFNIYDQYQSVPDALRLAFFQVSTIITTTGFATADFCLWPQLSQTLLLLLMICGACAGSTSGGLKISRLLLLIKSLGQEIRRLIHPRLTTAIRLEKKTVDTATLHDARTYAVAYLFIILVSTLLLSIDGFDLATNLSAELACFNNIGPGIGAVGPMSNYAMYSPFSKMLLSLNMLLGRLEIFPVIVLFSADVWRKKL